MIIVDGWGGGGATLCLSSGNELKSTWAVEIRSIMSTSSRLGSGASGDNNLSGVSETELSSHRKKKKPSPNKGDDGGGKVITEAVEHPESAASKRSPLNARF